MATKKKSPEQKKISGKIARKALPKAVPFRRKTDFLRDSSGARSLLAKRFLPENNSEFYYKNKKPANCKDLSDSELITFIHTQNTEAYKELFYRYQKKLFSYIFHLVRNKDETEDILQNVFSKMYKNIGNFDTSRKFSSWIYRIAHNESINFIKRKSKRYTVSWDDIATSKDKLDTATNDEPQEDRWLRQEVTKEIAEAIKKLPERYQQVLILRYFQEYSYEDIGKILNKPVNTIGTLINRAKKKLLEIIKKQGFTK